MALLLVAPGAAAIAAAQTLDAGAAKTQIVNRTWEQQAAHGPGKVYLDVGVGRLGVPSHRRPEGQMQ
jgi:hypothetical protein